MGGTALKQKYGFEGERMSASEYYRVCESLKLIANDKFDLFQIIPAYVGKLDHGDIDCVVEATHLNSENIATIFGSNFCKRNSYVYSFDFEGKYQVDLAVLPDDYSFYNYYNFCAYSPIGNVMGRILKQLGLKWGIDGLTYPVKISDSEQLGEIVLNRERSNDTFKMILDLFGSDKPYKEFGKQEEIFEFLVGSKYFNSDIFQFENLNHINRKRDRKRKDYHQWLEYIKDKPNKFVGNPDKTVYLEMLSEHFFVDIVKEWEKLLSKHLVRKNISEKFNGNIISTLTGKEGKELGVIIKNYKNSFGSQDRFDYWIMVHDFDSICKHFTKWYVEQKV